MPFNTLSKIAKNDAHVKIIFDYLKNIASVAVIGVAGKWQFAKGLNDPSIMSKITGLSIGCVLIATAFFLLFLNQEFAIYQIDKYSPPKWIRGLLHGYIFIIAISLVLYFISDNP